MTHRGLICKLVSRAVGDSNLHINIVDFQATTDITEREGFKLKKVLSNVYHGS